MRESIFEYVDRKVLEAKKLIRSRKSIDEFPDDLKELFIRWSKAHKAMTKYQARGDGYILTTYMTWLASDSITIDERTAREDIYAARLLYPDITGIVRETERLLDLSLLKDAAYKALADGKYGDFARIMAVRQKYLDPSNDPVEVPDYKEMANNFRVLAVFQPEILKIDRMTKDEVYKLEESMLSRKDALKRKLEDIEPIQPDEQRTDRIERKADSL